MVISVSELEVLLDIAKENVKPHMSGGRNIGCAVIKFPVRTDDKGDWQADDTELTLNDVKLSARYHKTRQAAEDRLHAESDYVQGGQL